ncbi:MAG: MFS transporter [Roseiflexus sp.]|nr:MFS transporter [Roseiflexus sp.]MCS7289216.1 MFS transporter [Roseiflexus sp.]MDW8146723.1 MFS transporter [Roseiflexaceae bacterium]MDW8232630.1 MFS transporter [Roseiflexaceae bacterium]
MHTSTPSPRVAALAALRYRDFRLLWAGQFVSITGTQMRNVAIAWQVYQLAQAESNIRAELALGLIGLARVIPLVITALFGGLAADRIERRKILILTSLAALICSVVLAFTAQMERPPLLLIYAMVALASVAGAFELPARQAIIPNLVAPQHLSNALSLNIVAWQLATVIGPALSGALIAAVGIAPVYWIDAATFLAVVAAALLMHTRNFPSRPEPVSLQAALAGLRFVFSHRLIATTMLLDFFAAFFGATGMLLPILADQVLRVGPAELGWMYAAPSAGALVAATLLSSIRIPRQGMTLLGAVLVFGTCVALVGMSRWLPLTLAALAGMGAADTVSMVIRGAIRQLLTPDELRGRMVAVNMVFFAGGPQLGEANAGFIASLIGAPATATLGGVMCILLVIGTALRVRELREYEGP